MLRTFRATFRREQVSVVLAYVGLDTQAALGTVMPARGERDERRL